MNAVSLDEAPLASVPPRRLRGDVYVALQRLRGLPLGRFVAELRATEQLSAAEFARLHAERLHTALEQARAHVPLYRSGPWERALARGHVEIDAWPVLERDVLRERQRELRAQPFRGRVVIRRTSGTTGKPVEIAFTPHGDTWGWAHRYRGLQWHGIPLGARSLRLSHDRRILRDFVLGQHNEPVLQAPGAVDRALRVLRNEHVDLVAGPPSALFYLARCLRERGVAGPLVRFARVGGEQLFPFQRAAIERHLGARAIDSYANTEIGALAGECPAGSMHVYAEHVHVEIFDGDSPAAPGELGDVVVTGLHNPAMPLVRYRVGERARLATERCRCGLPHPVLLDLRARSADVFRGADGAEHHGAELAARLGELFADPASNHVRQVQFTQLDPLTWSASLEVEASRRAAIPLGPLGKRLTALVCQVFGAGCRVDVKFVDRIERRNGKLRYYRVAEPGD